VIVNTQRLFVVLSRYLGINVVCDVGSMDGAEALRFRDALPSSPIYAFEPNPENFRLMEDNPVFRERNIELLPLAATDFDGEAEFFLVSASPERHDLRGLSSLYRRSGQFAPTAVVKTGTTRLDTFLAHKRHPDMRLALWIDVEGKAHEVIEGMTGIASRVQ